MSSKLTRSAAKVAAVTLGLLAPFAVAHAHRMAPGTGELGLDVELSTSTSGELHVEPNGRVAVASGLVPGGRSAEGRVAVRNQTAAHLGLAPLVTGTPGDADGAIWITISRGDRTVVRAPLSDLRRARRPAFVLAPHARARLRVRAWIPAGAPPGWKGRIANVPITWRGWVDGEVRR